MLSRPNSSSRPSALIGGSILTLVLCATGVLAQTTVPRPPDSITQQHSTTVPHPPDKPQQQQQQQPDSGQSEEPTTTFKVNVKLVNVFTTVTDSSGAPISTLKQEDFQVFEDDTPQ